MRLWVRSIEIPSRPDLSTLKHARLTPYLCEERYGIIWVCLVDEPRLGIPVFDQWEEEGFRFIQGPVTEWRCSSPRRLENYVDFGHFAWVHDGFLGSRDHPEVTDHEVGMLHPRAIHSRESSLAEGRRCRPVAHLPDLAQQPLGHGGRGSGILGEAVGADLGGELVGHRRATDHDHRVGCRGPVGEIVERVVVVNHAVLEDLDERSASV